MQVSEQNGFKVYCGGPLFNPKEQEEMQAIAAVLEAQGYTVFLPQRDGLELARILPILREKGVPSEDASLILNKAIFALDVYEVMDSDGLVLNMNGRVPDEGAMVEAGIAWGHGKEVVIYNSDDRSLVQGSCNPLVMGLGNFESVDDYAEIAVAFKAKFAGKKPGASNGSASEFVEAHRRGAQIGECLRSGRDPLELTSLLLDLFGENTCAISKGRKQISSPAITRP